MMKKLLLFTAISILATASFAQKKAPQSKQQKITTKYQTQQAKSAEKYQTQQEKSAEKYEQQIDKANEQSVKKTQKDLNRDMGMPPKRVQAAFLRQYPQATNISWAKSGSYYIATFNYGLRRQTAKYHADGRRIYTRRVVSASGQ